MVEAWIFCVTSVFYYKGYVQTPQCEIKEHGYPSYMLCSSIFKEIQMGITNQLTSWDLLIVQLLPYMFNGDLEIMRSVRCSD